MLKRFLLILSIIGSLFLFVGGPDYYSSRLVRFAWDLGHFCLFFVYTYTLLQIWESFTKRSFQGQVIFILLLSLILGILVEWSQASFDRTFSLKDILGNIVGSITAIAFLSPARLALSRKALRLSQLTLCILILLLTFPLARVLIDQVIARRQFPVLSNFETPFELYRWGGRSIISIDGGIVKEGKSSLKVQLNTEKYSGASLNHFPSDWHDYGYLHFCIFNSLLDPLKIIIRINDDDHISNGQLYRDRFNRQYLLSSGWNSIDIAINDIRNAPKNRLMNLRAIKNLTIFTVKLEHPRVIYIDDVRLRN